jgi:predicted ATPase
MSLLHTGDIAEARMHLDRAIMLYDPAEHRPLATRFGQDVGVATLSWRSLALWLLGYVDDALTDTERALKIAREFDHAATLMYALTFAPWIHINCGNYAAAIAQADEDVALADDKGIVLWKAFGMLNQGRLFTLTGRAPDAIRMITSAITALRSTGTTGWMPLCLSWLATTYAALGRFDESERCIDEAMTVVGTTQERWCEAEVNRIAGEIALLSSNPDAAKAEVYFERALAVARQQQAKSWELRAAMSMARLWRNQGRQQQAYDLLGAVYAWFTEGFDTLDLKQAKALLDALRA